MINLAILASGSGSNARKIIEHFHDHSAIRVSVVVTNKSTAGVVDIAETADIPVLVLEKEKFNDTGYVDELQKMKIDWIILAGFLWKVPGSLIHAFSGRIINIHPALLPKYGGKGMYGKYVHQAVIDANETESGLTIHYVDDEYDHGETIFQVRCPVEKHDTPELLASRILKLEHEHYPYVIESLLTDRSA